MSFSWSRSGNDSDESSSHGIVTTIIISSISGFCFFCCCFCVYKIRSSIRRVRVRNLATINAERARQYEILIHNQSASIIPDDLLELHLPKIVFDQSQVDWEAKTCCICFEDFSEGSEVRKLICKHIYHSKCIEEWFKGSIDIPRCPVCKANPFNGISDNSDLLLSPQSPLLVE
ncbi:unnamed protein product [Blepharisma stoltei]|uniref:RING-type domain-containing protein n=1 Tax=Blepharisma stoltei TaxID=1481888 RepID=A0AAU9JT58_9CILI|nr:unnamed protein product [Blepharisma stoltei]